MDYRFEKAEAVKNINNFCEITKKIKNNTITSFHYSEIYNDKTRIFLTENLYWFEKYHRYYFSISASAKLNNENSGFIAYPDFKEQKIFDIAKKDFEIDRPIFLINRTNEKREIAIFSVNTETNIYEFIYSNQEFLRKFFLYFKDKSKHLVKSVQKDREILPKSINEGNVLKNKDVISTENLTEEIDKYYVAEENVFLTKREMLCIKYTVQGNSSKKISSILDVSERTVNEHLNNVKKKLRAKTKFEMVYKVAKYNLV